MAPSRPAQALRARVAARDRHRCSYCLTLESVTGAPMEVDHIVPQSIGGPTEMENLCLACPRCNSYKADRIGALDRETREVVRLFHPLRQQWPDHFAWSDGSDELVGLTPCGRVTIEVLRMNRPALVMARQRWVRAGWHPPKD
jgi:hypothetical protein